MKKLLFIAVVIILGLNVAQAKEKYTLEQIAQMSEVEEAEFFNDIRKKLTSVSLVAGSFFEIKDADVTVNFEFDYSKSTDGGSGIGGTDEIEASNFSEDRENRMRTFESEFIIWFNQEYSKKRKVYLKTNDDSAPYKMVLKAYRHGAKIEKNNVQVDMSGLLFLYRNSDNSLLAVVNYTIKGVKRSGFRFKINENDIIWIYRWAAQHLASELDTKIKKAKEEKKK